MLRDRSIKIIIYALISLLLVTAVIGIVWWDQRLHETSGYGFLLGPSYPWERASKVLYQMVEFYNKDGEILSWKWPDVKIVLANMPELTLEVDQPYAPYGIYILKEEKIQQGFLYLQNKLITETQLERIKDKFSLSKKDETGIWHPRGASLVVACVMATRKDPNNVYIPYNMYPARNKKSVSREAWETWYFVTENDGVVITYHIQSVIPPIPGCLAYIDMMESKLSKFYYPEKIIPAFKAIYPNAEIPEEQILREGRDY